MTSTDARAVHEHTREEAIAWLIAFSEGEVTGSVCGQFESWLKASPENIRAYLQVSAFWEAAGHLNRARKTEMDDLVRKAAAEGSVITLHSVRNSALQQPIPKLRRWRRAVALVAGFVAVSAAGAILWWQLTSPPVYATQVGEQRTITLEDGSTVELNARSRIAVRFTAEQRNVDLSEGQALFRVAKNPARPFIVRSGDASVRAVGTEFDVDRKDSGTVVTVIEGQVAVFGSADPGSIVPIQATHAVLLAAGDQVTVSPKAISVPVHANPTQATAWTNGQLIFDSTPLADVIQAFNRYNAKTLSIDDPELLSLHVSGTFSTTDSAQIVRFLAKRFALTVHESSDSIRLSHK